MSHNSFSGALPEALCLLGNLTTVGAEFNGFESLPTCLGAQNQGLVSIFLDHNALTSTVSRSCRDFFRKDDSADVFRTSLLTIIFPKYCTQLPPNLLRYPMFVTVNHNRMSSEIPATLEVGPNLRRFQASNNQFHGLLPPTLLGAQRVKAIDLSNNRFTGPLPPSLCTANWLQFLFVQQNDLSGDLPECMYRPSSLLNITSLLMGCQGAPVAPYQQCAVPFNIPSTGPRSMAALVAAIGSLARIDVVPQPGLNLKGTTSANPSLYPDADLTVDSISTWVVVSCIVAAVIAIAAAQLWGDGLSTLDKYPQYGFMTDVVPGR